MAPQVSKTRHAYKLPRNDNGNAGFMGLVKNPYILLQSFFASIGGLLYG